MIGKSSIKKAIEDGDSPFGTWVSVGHPAVVEANAQLNIDFVLIDTEHTTISLETVENMARGVEAAPGTTEVVVRVPWNDPVRLKRIVDIGVAGVMVPMIDSADDARELVQSLRYPPDGIRGIASSRATGYGRDFEEYVETANDSILTIAQIETEQGLENVEEIASVDGIDALFVGPADLSGTLGVFANWQSDTYQEAIEYVVNASHSVDVPVGTLTLDIDGIEDCLEQGFDFLIVGKDTAQIMDRTEAALQRYDELFEKEDSSGS